MMIDINYSISNSVFMMMDEFIVTAFVIVAFSMIVLVHNKAFKSELSTRVSYFSQLTVISISVLEIATKRTNAGSTSITWSDDTHQFYTHTFLGFTFSLLFSLLGLYDYKMKGDKDSLKDRKEHVSPCFVRSWFVLVIFFLSASPLRHEENLITNARVITSSPSRTTIVYADGLHWLFDMDKNESDKSMSREIARGDYKMLCTSGIPTAY